LKVVFSAESIKDLANVQHFGELKFGVRAALAYQETLRRSIDTLQEFPAIAREREELIGRRRALVSGSHLIIYQLHAEYVEITRVVSSRQDLSDIL
jgi:plasmid stabilization system protein ParE